jgi:hypothetical protein
MAIVGALAGLAAGCGDTIEIRPDAATLPDVAMEPAADAAYEVARDSSYAAIDTLGADLSKLDAAVSPDAGVEGLAPDTAPPMPDTAIDVAVGDSSDASPDQTADGGGCSAPGCPSMLAPGHLQLWLRGDQGVECAPVDNANRVTAWRDLSPKGHDALPATGKHGPLCGASAGAINGRPVIKFPRTPGLDAEEHLEVDFTSLLDHSFTIAFVDRRPSATDPFNSWVIGSKLPYPDGVSCDDVGPNSNQGLAFGYLFSSSLYVTAWGKDCDAIGAVSLGDDLAHMTVVTFSPSAGLKVFRDGAADGSAPSEGLKSTMGGYLGRGFQQTPDGADSRFLGDVAEVVVIDDELDTERRQALESYLQIAWNVIRHQ